MSMHSSSWQILSVNYFSRSIKLIDQLNSDFETNEFVLLDVCRDSNRKLRNCEAKNALSISIACNDNVCTPPNCFCSQQSYGNKSIKNIPQMVILLFVGNLDKLSYDMYNRLSILQNPNGCPVTLTFSIQNIRESNPCVVQQLFSSMNEFAVSSASDK
ncbi:hypothetical protein GJ496_006984 [Pomphorhynchus laevis]|nr:hypothetical protein GJ496_007215 [Pomphorhynchus laevis]KAI0989786.1 hypothetical protein GJ496_006984 [Pomphorhynchus laevis]